MTKKRKGVSITPKVFYEHLPHLHLLTKPLASFPPHVHHEIEIIFCTEGEYVAECEEKTFTLHAGDMIIVLPYVVHTYTANMPSRGILCVVSLDFFPLLESSLYRKPGVFFWPNAPADMTQCLTHAMNEYAAEKNLPLIIGYLLTLLGHAVKHADLTDRLSANKEELFAEILHFINSNFQKPLNGKALAQHFGYDPTYLSKRFVSKMGCTLTQYIHELRIDKAKQLLDNGDLSMKQIAFACGFTNRRTFDRVFLAQEHCSPTAYRQKTSPKKEKPS